MYNQQIAFLNVYYLKYRYTNKYSKKYKIRLNYVLYEILSMFNLLELSFINKDIEDINNKLSILDIIDQSPFYYRLLQIKNIYFEDCAGLKDLIVFASIEHAQYPFCSILAKYKIY